MIAPLSRTALYHLAEARAKVRNNAGARLVDAHRDAQRARCRSNMPAVRKALDDLEQVWSIGCDTNTTVAAFAEALARLFGDDVADLSDVFASAERGELL